MKSELQILSEFIKNFLSKYATLNPNYQDIYDNFYASPDANELKYCADLLENNEIPIRCFSEWSSGGYKPYSCKIAQNYHDDLVKSVNIIILNKP